MDKCVKTQSIIAIVGQVGHEYTDLGWRKRDRVGGVERKRERNVEKEIYTVLIVLCKIVIKSKSHFPSSHVKKKTEAAQ